MPKRTRLDVTPDKRGGAPQHSPLSTSHVGRWSFVTDPVPAIVDTGGRT
jgi:hypothetical protein